MRTAIDTLSDDIVDLKTGKMILIKKSSFAQGQQELDNNADTIPIHTVSVEER